MDSDALVTQYEQLHQRMLTATAGKKWSAALNLKLERIERLLALLGNPHRAFASIHVGGTSGKGSTCLLTARLLEHLGYKVGLHTSPHLHLFNERHQINGRVAPTSTLAELYEEIEPLLETVAWELPQFGKPSYFEVQFALSCLWFALENVDVAVVEVGLGGTLDATNVLPATVAVLTSIGLDHTEILGYTVEQIASDKAGIIKPGQTVISGVTQPGARGVIQVRCTTKEAKLIQYGFQFAQMPHFAQRNAMLAQAAVDAFHPNGLQENPPPPELLELSLPGRMELIQQQPDIVLDGAHNPDKLEAAYKAMRAWYGDRPIIVVLAIKQGKDVMGMAEFISQWAYAVVCTEFTSGMWQSTPVDELAMRLVDTRVATEADLRSAIDLAIELATLPDAVVWVTGSLYLVGEIRQQWYPNAQLLVSAENGDLTSELKPKKPA